MAINPRSLLLFFSRAGTQSLHVRSTGSVLATTLVVGGALASGALTTAGLASCAQEGTATANTASTETLVAANTPAAATKSAFKSVIINVFGMT